MREVLEALEVLKVLEASEMSEVLEASEVAEVMCCILLYCWRYRR